MKESIDPWAIMFTMSFVKLIYCFWLSQKVIVSSVFWLSQNVMVSSSTCPNWSNISDMLIFGSLLI